MTCAACCINCKYAKWQRTPTGRVSKIRAGRCMWQAQVAVPFSIKRDCEPMTLKPKSYVWPNDGHGCPTFEAAS